MAERHLAPLELAKSAIALLQDGADSDDEILALSLVTSAVALHLLRQPYNGKRRRVVANERDNYSRRSFRDVESTSPRYKVRHEDEYEDGHNTNIVNEQLDECTSSVPHIPEFKIEYSTADISADQSQSPAEPVEWPQQSSDDSRKKRRRQWSRFEDDRRRVLLRLNSSDSVDMVCAEPKITDYMGIFLDGIKMDISTFNLLLSLVRKDLERQNTCMRMPVASEQRLAVVLRYLSTGESYNAIERSVKISRAFLCVNIPLLCKALWTNLKDRYLKMPSCEGEWASKAEEFDSRWQFPLCLGALTRRHFKFKTPRSASVVALVDANNKFIHVDIEKEDESVYLGHEDFPPPQSIGNNRVLPYVFIAQDGFDLDEHIMTPFNHEDTSARRVFNTRLKASSQVADQTFRMLQHQFRVLGTPLYLLQAHIEDVIRASCILHNFLMEHNPELYAPGIGDEDTNDGSEVITANEHNHFNENAEAVREEFAEYFSNEGAAPTFDVKMFDEEGTSASNVLLDMLSI